MIRNVDSLSQLIAIVVTMGLTGHALAQCDPPVAAASGSRYLSVTPEASASPVAIYVQSTDACMAKYVDAGGALVDEPFYQLPEDWGTVHVTGVQIVPSTTFNVQVDCGAELSAIAAATTWAWADGNDDGQIDIDDILCRLDGFAGSFSACALQAADVSGADPNRLVDLADIVAVTDAFVGLPYPYVLPPSELPPPPATPTIDAHIPETSLPNITLSGSAPEASYVRVTGLLATTKVPVSSGTWSTGVPLHVNAANPITVIAIGPCGGQSPPAFTEVLQDGQAPSIYIDYPADGADVTTSMTSVAGRIGDGLSLIDDVIVTVNGSMADVNSGTGNNGTFYFESLPLSSGTNVITAAATDGLNNTSQVQITITHTPPPVGSPTIEIVAGDNQDGEVGSQLVNDLEVQILMGDGTAFENKLVTFKVVRSDGRLTEDGTGEGSLLYQTFTDTSGMASAVLHLGSDAGCGNNRVEVTSTSVVGTTTFIASATPASADQINISSGNHQRAEINTGAADPLRVIVTDGHNPVDGVDVTFTVVAGGGLVDGMTQVMTTTEAGCAEVDFELGPFAGNNRVEATFVGNANAAAQFVIRGIKRLPDAQTSFTTLVLTNSDQPVEGATCQLQIGPSIVGETQSGLDGKCSFDALADSGAGYLHVDGGTATHIGGAMGVDVPTGTFPVLEYEVVITPNTTNGLPTPVYLPTLNAANDRSYSTTTDIELTVDGIEGLKMTVTAGSMFVDCAGPDISDCEPALDGTTVRLNPVDFDRIPMPMPDGAAPPLAWTLQPSGARFSPPVKIEFPNMMGLPAGAITHFMSFDHDAGEFIAVSSAHVSDDGSTIVSDPGDGLDKAGWGGPFQTGFGGEAEKGPDRPDDPEDCDDCECEHSPDAGVDNGQDGEDKSDFDPVHLFSGEFYIQEEDLRIKGRGFDFVWIRTYRARLGPNTAQGNGWDFNYNMVVEQSGNDFTVRNGRTRADRYRMPDGGQDLQSPEFFDRLVPQPNVTYFLELSDRGQWEFNSLIPGPTAGKIDKLADRNGNTMRFEYDGAGRLTTIRDTLDSPSNPRVITIAYNGDGFIESVTDFIGRQVRFEYYQDGDAGGSFGDLKSVTSPVVTGTPTGNDFPDGKTTTYTYTSGFADERLNHNLLTITDPKGQEFVRNTYADTEDPNDLLFDRIVRQSWGDPTDIADVSYYPLVPLEDENNQAKLVAVVNDRMGNVAEHYYDIRNRLVMRREYTGRAIADEPTSLDDNRPTGTLREADPDYFETRWDYNVDSQVVRETFPNGNYTEFVYQSELTPGASARTRGNLREKHRYPGPLGGDQPVISEYFEYDDGMGSCCGSNFVTKHTDGRSNDTVHEYDDFGNRTHTTHRIPAIVEDWEYNGFGQLNARVLPDNGSGHRRRDEFAYYETGPQTGYRESKIVDAGNFALTTTYEYDDVGNATREIDAKGSDDLFEFNALDQLVRHTSREVTIADDPPVLARYDTDYYYDANDNRVRLDVQNIDGYGVLQPNTHYTQVYEYEILNNVTRMCQESGEHGGAIPGTVDQPSCKGFPENDWVSEEYSYDANRNKTLVRYGEAVEGRQPENEVLTLHDERDLAFQVTRAPASPDRSTTQYDYDGNRNVVSKREGIEGGEHVTTTLYDGYNRQVAATDPMGNVTTRAYDANGNRTNERVDGELIDVPGGSSNFRLAETTSVFDDMDRRTREEVAHFETATGTPVGDGLAVTETQYSHNSQIALVTNDNGHSTSTAYDTANRRALVTDAKANTRHFTYDVNSNVTSVNEVDKSDLGNADQEFTTNYTYDAIDRPECQSDNIGNTNCNRYDSRDNLARTIDANGREGLHTFDGLSRNTAIIRDMNGDGPNPDAVPCNYLLNGNCDPDITTTTTWDDTSRIVGRTDDNDNTTAYVWDALNRKIAEEYADCTQDTFEYNAHDNIVERTDGNGSLVEMAYDALHRLARVDATPGIGVSDDTTYEDLAYDGVSRMVLGVDDDSMITFTYDSLSNVTVETLNGQATASTFDGESNKLTCTYPGGRQIDRTYDELERVSVISDSGSMIGEYYYVGPARVERKDLGNGTRTDIEYDGITGVPNPAGDFGVKRVIRKAHTRVSDGLVIDDRTFAWDAMYNKIQRADIRPDGPQLVHDYSYDSIYRLTTSVVTPPGDPEGRVDYQLDGVGSRIVVSGGDNPGSYTMSEAECEPADFQVNQYSTTPFGTEGHDKNGNLAMSSVGAPTETLIHDYRNWMVVYRDDVTGVETEYVYDVLRRRIGKTVDVDETDGPRQPTLYFYDGIRVCEEQGTGGGEMTYVDGKYIDEHLSLRRGGENYYYHCDDMSSSTVLTDNSAAPRERYDYSDFGSVRAFDANGAPVSPQLGNVYTFTGRRVDQETGLLYYRTRYYSSIRGQFTARDTIGVWGDLSNMGNGRAYVGNNPATYGDPLGLARGNVTCNWWVGKQLWYCTPDNTDCCPENDPCCEKNKECCPAKSGWYAISGDTGQNPGDASCVWGVCVFDCDFFLRKVGLQI